ncbi:hypothetical protein CK203_113280 [Vitis vinifera]|uniref:Uncharacterized protein n=1 Tax=Vitis vinifera TaxID=29760 RepID=A0A438EIJ5_VITVI|nr:hypothetical protein CK203_113280 [Vitis vinifera]
MHALLWCYGVSTRTHDYPVVDMFDKLALVWGKPRQPPLGSEEVRADDLS